MKYLVSYKNTTVFLKHSVEKRGHFMELKKKGNQDEKVFFKKREDVTLH